MDEITFSRQAGKGDEQILRTQTGREEERSFNGQSTPTEEDAHSRQTNTSEEMTLSSPMETPIGTAESPAQNTTPVTAAGKTAEKILLREGQTLRLLALDLFGSREFWVYIYLENKNNIHNPNVVPVGTELIIPDPSHYHIDASDPQSVSKAKAAGDELLQRW